MFCILEPVNFIKTLKMDDAQHKQKTKNICDSVLSVSLVYIFQPWELPMEQLNPALE